MLNKLYLPVHSFLTLSYPMGFNIDPYLNDIKGTIIKNSLSFMVIKDIKELSNIELNYPNDINFILFLNENWKQEHYSKLKELSNKFNYSNDIINFNLKKGIFLEQSCKIDDVNEFKSNLRYATKQLFSNILNILEPTELNLILKEVNLFNRTKLETNKKVFIIWDVHEQVEELKLLLQQVWIKFKGDEIIENELELILLGDFIDKGGQTKEIVDLLYKNKHHFKIVRGNHESYAEKKLNNKLDWKSSMSEEEELFKFSSLKVLLNDLETKNKFLELSNDFFPFISIKSHNIFLTHAPCQESYLNKMDRSSLKKQRNSRAGGEDKYNEDSNFDDYIKELSLSNKSVKHIFGHISLKNPFEFKNQLNLDTGCVYWNYLTGLLIGEDKEFKLFYQDSLKKIKEPRKLLEKVLETKVINFNL